VQTKAMVPSGFEDSFDVAEPHDDALLLEVVDNGDGVDETTVDEEPPAESSSSSQVNVEAVQKKRRPPWIRSDATTLGLLVGVLIVCVLAGLVGWLGVTAYQAHSAQQQRQLFLQAGRQGALNLTTIRYADVDSDVQRVLDASTGKFYDEFKSHTTEFAAAVRQAKSSSTGDVSEAGIESVDGDTARVLVTVAVRTATVEGQSQEPRYWRMRVVVKKVDQSAAKVADVEFVP
jgi:Mce-associated membrane protein